MKSLDKEITLEYIRSSGPGGQNVNKVSTAVQLRFDVIHSPSLPDDVKTRLLKIAGKRVTNEGMLIVEGHRFRTQEQNRKDAMQRLYELVKKANQKPKARHKTKPTKASKEKRIEQKKKRGETKKTRARIVLD